MKKKILCMYSGGVDSVGVLHRLLTEDKYKDFEVRVHHMQLINREKRAPAERLAVQKTLKYFRANEYRPFTFSHCTHDYSFMRFHMIWDMDIAAFMAGNICAFDASIAHVARGRTKTDLQTGGDKLLKRTERATNIFNSIIGPSKSEADIIYPVIDLDKTGIWQMLPKPLRDASWYCRTPIYDAKKIAYPCNRCITCKEMGVVYKAMGEEPPQIPEGVVIPRARRKSKRVVIQATNKRPQFPQKKAKKKG